MDFDTSQEILVKISVLIWISLMIFCITTSVILIDVYTAIWITFSFLVLLFIVDPDEQSKSWVLVKTLQRGVYWRNE